MTVHFLLHGILIRLAGTEQLSLELPAPCTLQAALEKLAEQQPAMQPELQRSACAIGDVLVRRDTQIRDEARIALIPPVSGG